MTRMTMTRKMHLPRLLSRPTSLPGKRRIIIYMAYTMVIIFFLYQVIIQYIALQTIHSMGNAEQKRFSPPHRHPLESRHNKGTITQHHDQADHSSFSPTLRGKKILMEITTVGLTQYAYFEMVLDSIRDLCESGAQISLHVTTTNCNRHQTTADENNTECPLYGQYRKKTFEDNYSVEKINQLNERLRCRDVEGNIDAHVHLVSPEWGKEVINHHRRLFYDNINKGYNLFIHTEEDEAITPSNVISFMDELEKLRRLVGDQRLPDYNIGFVRYENDYKSDKKERVVWEFDWGDEINNTIDHPHIEGKYFTSPPKHHQGMFMCTAQQLQNWATRSPECNFNRPVRRPAYHRERVGGGLDLYDVEICNVTQLIPLNSLEDFYIHHLPDANNKRSPERVVKTMSLHKWRMRKLKSMDSSKEHNKLWVDKNGKYNGIKMFVDEVDEQKQVHVDLSDYRAYVDRGGIMTDKELEE